MARQKFKARSIKESVQINIFAGKKLTKYSRAPRNFPLQMGANESNLDYVSYRTIHGWRSL